MKTHFKKTASALAVLVFLLGAPSMALGVTIIANEVTRLYNHELFISWPAVTYSDVDPDGNPTNDNPPPQCYSNNSGGYTFQINTNDPFYRVHLAMLLTAYATRRPFQIGADGCNLGSVQLR